MATVNDELRKRIMAQQARDAMPLKKTTVTDAESGLAITGPKGQVMNALQKRDSAVVGYSPKQARQMTAGGSFGYAGPSFKGPAAAGNNTGEPEWLTKENSPTMGWQQRTAINRELAANYRQRQGDITDLEQTGIQARTTLAERSMQERGMDTRQQAGFGQQTRERLGTQAFTTGERLGTQKFTTGEREAKQGFLSEQEREKDFRKLGSDYLLASGDPAVAEQIFNAPSYGAPGFGESALPKKTVDKPYSYQKGRTETIYGPQGLQTKEYPDRVFDQSTGQWYDIPSANGVQGLQGPGQVIDLANASEQELQALKKKKEIEEAKKNAIAY